MSTKDARSTTLRDLHIDPDVVAHDHRPVLHPRERFVRCERCGLIVSYPSTSEMSVRQALNDIASVRCDRYEIPDVFVGDHHLTITSTHPTYGRRVVCESCGRTARLGEDPEDVLESLTEIPCISRLSHTELTSLVFSPNEFSPPFDDLGISNWYGRTGNSHDDVVRQFRHERFQYTIHLQSNPDDSYTAVLRSAPDRSTDPIDELQFPNADSDDAATLQGVIRLLTFLSATDSLTAGSFSELHTAYENAYQSHRSKWISDAYLDAQETFKDQFDDTPEAFTNAFTDGTVEAKEVLRRMIGSGGFSDQTEPTFAREILGRTHRFPRFISFVASNHGWSPPISTGTDY